MIQHITPDRVANSILQDRSFNGSYLLVEGQTDYTLYNKFVDGRTCEIKIAHGNQNVIDVVHILIERDFDAAIGLIDADFRIIENDVPVNKNLFLTDEHDLEMMVLKSPAFDIVVGHYIQPSKADDFIKENANQPLRDILINLVKPLGYLKLLNKVYDLNIPFKSKHVEEKDLPLQDFIPYKTLKYSGHERMIEAVFNYSTNRSSKIRSNKPEVLANLTKQMENEIDKYMICNGHDVINILSLSLRSKLSNKNASDCSVDQLHKELIFAYDSKYFQSTKTYNDIKDWETKNSRRIFKF